MTPPQIGRGAPVKGQRVAAALVRAGQRALGDVRHQRLDGPRRDGAATWQWPAPALSQGPRGAGRVRARPCAGAAGAHLSKASV